MALDPRQLRAFLTIARSGSLGLAAESLHVTQPALSRIVRLVGTLPCDAWLGRVVVGASTGLATAMTVSTGVFTKNFQLSGLFPLRRGSIGPK